MLDKLILIFQREISNTCSIYLIMIESTNIFLCFFRTIRFIKCWYISDEICPRTPMPPTSTESYTSPTTAASAAPCYTPTTDGDNCTFPFIYIGVVYMECITGVDGRDWCSLTTLYDQDRMFGYCLGNYRWFSVRLQYLQCVSNGDTEILH